MNTVGRRIGQGATVGYALLWALVLPFICWANWAQPGHAHAAPHFIFSEPPTHIQHFHPTSHRYPTNAMHPPVVREHDPGVVQTDSIDGVARPLTLIVALLALVLFRLAPLPRPRLHHWPQTARLILPPFYALPIPTPPPRPAYLGGSLPGYLG